MGDVGSSRDMVSMNQIRTGLVHLQNPNSQNVELEQEKLSWNLTETAN
jgi:hypothetical protein